jgi:hypothetical protein
MAMKFTVTFLLLISIGEIYSKTLLERIRDDSDLSQVSPFSTLMILCGASPLGHPRKREIFSLCLSPGGQKKKRKKLEKFWLQLEKRYIIARRKECCVT